MSALKLVIFDLDGTLIDTVALFVGAITSVFERVGEPVPEEKAIRSISGLGAQAGVRHIAPGADDARINELIGLYREEYLARATQSMREALFPGALQALNTLHGRDEYVLAVATGKPLASTNRVLDAHQVKGLFTSIQTPDTNIAKPDPDMILTAMGIVDVVPEKTIMIGDTTHDMNMSVAAGVKALGVDWGYHQPEELNAAGADMIVRDFDQMINAIDKLLE
ncbi:MAG: HAD-IA family hydrolase [Devosiaceae bacterium]|nr:HAD-IA family hydrolase [Devosiaceae bacterium]